MRMHKSEGCVRDTQGLVVCDRSAAEPGVARRPQAGTPVKDGSIGYGLSKGSLYSTLISTGLGAAGAGINAGTGLGGWQAGMVTTTANAIGSGFQFSDDGSYKGYDAGKMGISFAANTASNFASYGTQQSMKGSGLSNSVTGMVANQVGRAANVVTASILGDQNAYQAYMPQGFFSTVGTNIGDYMADRFNNRGTPANPSSPSQPLREIFLGGAIITARREQEFEEATEGWGEVFGGDTSDEDRRAMLTAYYGNATDAESQQELMRLAQRGFVNEEDLAAIARQQVATGVEDGGTKKLPLVPANPDKLMTNLGKQYGMSKEEMELRYVMANNPNLDPNDADAYETARDKMRSTISNGGTINMPAGVGEYTRQTDQQFGYAKSRADSAAAAMAQLGNTAGLGGNNKWLLGTDSIVGRQPLNLTPDQAFQMELGLANTKLAVAKERMIDQRYYGTAMRDDNDPLFMKSNSFVQMRLTGRTPVEMLTNPQVITEKLTFTGWEQVPNPINRQAFNSLSEGTEINLAMGVANGVSMASGLRGAYMLGKLGYSVIKAGQAAAAAENLTALQGVNLLTGNWQQAGAIGQAAGLGQTAGVTATGGVLKSLFPNPGVQATYGAANAAGTAYWDYKLNGSVDPMNAVIGGLTNALTGPGGYPTQTLRGAFAYNAFWSGAGNIAAQVISNGGVSNFSVPQFAVQTTFGGLSGVTQQMMGQSATLNGANQIQRWRDESMNMGLWWPSPQWVPK